MLFLCIRIYFSDNTDFLVDCWATEHVMIDKSKFNNFDQNFEPGNHFSVQAAAKNNVHISSEHDNCQLIYPNSAVFNITLRGHFYYLKNIVSARNATYDLHTWHKFLGH